MPRVTALVLTLWILNRTEKGRQGISLVNWGRGEHGPSKPVATVIGGTVYKLLDIPWEYPIIKDLPYDTLKR